ncbi:MAG: restriction endonuclease subunit S, partial [Brevibacterium aurantiacum]
AIPDPELIDTRYLFNYLLAQRPDLQNRGRGGTQQNISQRDLKNWTVPLPPLDEQRRIAAILDKADAIRQKRRQAIAHGETISQAIFNQMFASHNWNTTIQNHAELKIGPFGSALHKVDYTYGEVPVINPMHIVNGNLAPNPNFTVSEAKAQELKSYRLIQGDVVLGRRGELGRAGIAHSENVGYVCGTGSMIVRPHELASQLMHAVLTSTRMRTHFRNESLGSTMPNLNLKIVGSSPCPEFTAQDSAIFRASISKVHALTKKHRTRLLVADTLFDSLQSRAFRGEL